MDVFRPMIRDGKQENPCRIARKALRHGLCCMDRSLRAESWQAEIQRLLNFKGLVLPLPNIR